MVVGQVVSVLAFYSDNLIRNPPKVSLHFFIVKTLLLGIWWWWWWWCCG